jgi:hypothetical protein
LQVNYGFGPVFAGILIMYIISVYLYWKFFWSSQPAGAQITIPAD